MMAIKGLSTKASAVGAPRLNGGGVSAGRLQHRRAQVLIGALAFIVVGVAVSLWAYQAMNDREPVVALAADVAAGEVIDAADVTTVELPTGSGLAAIPGDQLGTVIGQRAVSDLAAGTSLSPAQIGDRPFPPAGEQLVPVPLGQGQMPMGLQPGDHVLAVLTAGDSSTSTGSDDQPLGSWPAVVHAVGGADVNGTSSVDVLADEAVGQQLGAAAATGRLILLLDPAGR